MKEKEENSNLDLQRYEAEYSERGLFDKLSSVAKKAGLKVVYYALILYYALQSPKISVKEKALIIGALGYFILPVDLVPDVIAGAGFLDDAAALLAVIKMLTCIEDENGELIAGGVSMPSIAEALQKCRGELFPFGWWHLLKAMFWKRSDTAELLLIGVLPEWQKKGVVALLFQDLIKVYSELGFKYAETNGMLESNLKIQSMFGSFEREIHKRRWVFGKEI